MGSWSSLLRVWKWLQNYEYGNRRRSCIRQLRRRISADDVVHGPPMVRTRCPSRVLRFKRSSKSTIFRFARFLRKTTRRGRDVEQLAEQLFVRGERSQEGGTTLGIMMATLRNAAQPGLFDQLTPELGAHLSREDRRQLFATKRSADRKLRQRADAQQEQGSEKLATRQRHSWCVGGKGTFRSSWNKLRVVEPC